MSVKRPSECNIIFVVLTNHSLIPVDRVVWILLIVWSIRSYKVSWLWFKRVYLSHYASSFTGGVVLLFRVITGLVSDGSGGGVGSISFASDSLFMLCLPFVVGT